MSKFTANEIGKMIGQSRQYVNVYYKRGRLVRESDETFDLSHPLNKSWYEPLRKKYLASGGGMEQVEPKSTKKTEIKEHPKPKEAKKDNNQEGQIPEINDNAFGWAERKLRAEAELKELNVEKTRIEIEQKQGKLLDIDKAKGIVSAYLSAYANNLFRDLETFTYRILDIHKVPLTEKAKYSKLLEELMNAASERTMQEVNKKLENPNTQL